MMEQRRLKSGYTTGTCAAIAAKAATRILLGQRMIEIDEILTPKGKRIRTEILDASFDRKCASCAVKKDAGDDPDVTHGLLIYASVEKTEAPGIVIDGGEGVGRVTKPGLSQAIGEAAINRVPRQMILEHVTVVCEQFAYEGGLRVVISVPGGKEIAEKTFNPRLGIVGGISILGTSGIVEPMSEQAIIDTIRVEMNVKRQTEGEHLMIAPGNYGMDFIRETYHMDLDRAVKCSNYVGEALDYAVGIGLKSVLLIGHIGKFVKLSGGIMNTHSRNADARMELLTAAALPETDDTVFLQRLSGCLTTDEAVEMLKEKGICDAVMKRVVEKALYYAGKRVQDEVELGLVIFSNVHGVLGESENAKELFQRISEQSR